MDKVTCPLCGKKFELEYCVEIGDITYCSECQGELKLVRLHPPKVERFEEQHDETSDEVDAYSVDDDEKDKKYDDEDEDEDSEHMTQDDDEDEVDEEE